MAFRKLLDRVENMRIRTRLLALMLLFGMAVAINILALFFLTRSIASSLADIERVRVRQLVAVEMDEKLRNAEAALYRYYLEGATGFAAQFDDQITSFGASVAEYRSLASTSNDLRWANALEQTWQSASSLGKDLIRLRDKQTGDLKALIAAHAQLSAVLAGQFKPLRGSDLTYQRALDGMGENARGMLLAVTAYLAAPDESTRGQFTSATIQFQQDLTEFRRVATTDAEVSGIQRIDAAFLILQNLGSQLISDRDRQQALFARFFAEIFQASQNV